MTIYGIVITVLLLFPWALVGLTVVGAAWSAVTRRPGCAGRAPVSLRGRSVLSRSESQGGEMPLRSLPADESGVPRYHDSARRAA